MPSTLFLVAYFLALALFDDSKLDSIAQHEDWTLQPLIEFLQRNPKKRWCTFPSIVLLMRVRYWSAALVHS